MATKKKARRKTTAAERRSKTIHMLIISEYMAASPSEQKRLRAENPEYAVRRAAKLIDG
jgi:hypothetical protein